MMYSETNNPLFAWEAFLDARSSGLPVPEWALEYLDRVARRFASMTRRHAPKPYRGAERRRQSPTAPRTANIGPERRLEAVRMMYGALDPAVCFVPSKGRIAEAVTTALELRPKNGSYNPFTEMLEQSHQIGIAIEVLFERQQGTGEDAAIYAVASHHPSTCERPKCRTISYSTVRRCWQAHGKQLLGS
jgi:hypothetical protein